MIVVDENLHDQRIMAAISAWARGQVVSVTTLRPNSVIKDEAIPGLLRETVRPTFVTINVTDFWQKVEPHRGYCIINVALPKERAQEIPGLLRRLFRLPDFRTKALRMGKVIRLTPQRIEYYKFDRRIQSLPWPDQDAG
jgi:hypothetical protein